MSDLVGDIKKIDQDKIKEGREILLKYLAEVDQKNDSPKPPKRTAMDGLVTKTAGIKPGQPRPDTFPPSRTNINFVDDLKSAESKLDQPLTEIIHHAIAKPATSTKIESVKPKPTIRTLGNLLSPTNQAEVVIDEKPAPEKPAKSNPPLFKSSNLADNNFPQQSDRHNKRKAGRKTPAINHQSEKNLNAAWVFIGRIFFKFLSFIALVVIIYFVFGLALYTFNFDNGATRFITKIFPVPAFITQYGVVNYYDYLDVKKAMLSQQQESDRTLGETLAAVEAREKLIKRQIIRSVAADYGMTINLTDSAESELSLQKKLGRLIVADPNINKDNLSKLRSIKSFLLGGVDFSLAAASYGLQARTEYFTADAVKEKFGQKALELAAGATIETTSVAQGYYVFQFYNQQNDLTGFRFIFVPAKTLEMILAEKYKTTDLIILAN